MRSGVQTGDRGQVRGDHVAGVRLLLTHSRRLAAFREHGTLDCWPEV